MIALGRIVGVLIAPALSVFLHAKLTFMHAVLQGSFHWSLDLPSLHSLYNSNYKHVINVSQCISTFQA